MRVTCPALPPPALEFTLQLRGAGPGAAWEVRDVRDTPNPMEAPPRRKPSVTPGRGGHAHRTLVPVRPARLSLPVLTPWRPRPLPVIRVFQSRPFPSDTPPL